jgi:hypothetical protein
MSNVWSEEFPADKVYSYQCAWKDCKASFKGEMPRGWVWLLTYWAAEPVAMSYPVPGKDILRDTVLCPQHNHALERLLVDILRPLRGPPAGHA